jgi:hypothetical protein
MSLLLTTLWCRAARPGTHELRLLFSYTPMPDAAAVMGYRLCEVGQTLHVLHTCMSYEEQDT